MKDKQWKDYWDVALGVSYIPQEKLDPQTNLSHLEEGGTFDDDTIPDWMKNLRNTQPAIQPGFVPAPSDAAAAALGVPLQAVAGVDPTLAATHHGIPIPGASPFGLPPGLPPPGGLLGHPPGVLLPPGGPAGPNLLMPPRFGPPGFPPPTFDASQPPPMRMPFPPPTGPQNVPNVEGQGEVDMEIEDQDDHQRPSQKAGGGRGSRWGNSDANADVNDVQSRLRNLAEGGGGPRNDFPPDHGGPGGNGPPPGWNGPPDGPPDRGKSAFSIFSTHVPESRNTCLMSVWIG